MFDPHFALTVGIPLASAAYEVMNPANHNVVGSLPEGFEQTSLIVARTIKASVSPLVKDASIMGLIAKDATTTYVALRGTETPEEWLQDFSAVPTHFRDFGDVADGFLDVYSMFRQSMMNGLMSVGTQRPIVVVGHSLGAATALLAALDIQGSMHIEPKVLTFAGPRVGTHSFVTAFNRNIESCYRVTNSLDIVPHVPPAPFEHVGTEVRINSGGPIDLVHRHLLPAYKAGLGKL